MNLGEKIKKQRKKLGLSQGELADLTEMNRISIHNYESGKRSPKENDLKKIASALGLNITDLVNDQITTFEIWNQKTNTAALAKEVKEWETLSSLFQLMGYSLSAYEKDDQLIYSVADQTLTADFSEEEIHLFKKELYKFTNYLLYKQTTKK